MKGCGCSLKILIGILVFVVVLVLLGLVVGPIGVSLLGHVPGLSVLSMEEPPAVHLPSNTVFKVAGFPVTNTLLASMITTVLLIVVAWLATRRMKLVPGRFQGLIEYLVETLVNFAESIAGKHYGAHFFPIFATIFLFVAVNAYLALLPFYGDTILVSHTVTQGGRAVTEHFPLLRAANTDVNLPLALAICAVIFVEYWGIRALGTKHYLSEFFNFGQFFHGIGSLFKGKVRTGLADALFGVVNIFIGFIELLSHMVRLVSFTFRLFGNMTAGEILLVMVTFLVPFIVAIPFYGLELIVGLIQALIFAGLTLVFATIAVRAGGGEEEHH